MNFIDSLETLILIGAIQAFVLALFLYSLRKNKESNSVLAVILLLISFKTLIFFANEQLHLFNEFWRYIIRSTQFLLPPLLYLYALRVLKVGSKLSFSHLVPSLVFLVLVIGYFKTDFTFFKYFEEVLGVFGRELTIALILAYYFILFKRVSNTALIKSDSAKPDISWLNSLFLFYLVLAFFSVVISAFLRFPLFPIMWNPFILVQMSTAIFMYWISYKVFTQPLIFYRQRDKHQLFNPNYQKYRGAKLSKEDKLIIVQQLKTLMNNSQPFLKPDIRLHHIANQMGITGNRLSQVINDEFHQSFNNLINSYRIEFAKTLLSNDEFRHVTISSIAFDSGFNSLPTFNRVFKEFTLHSPKEFRANNILNR